jgi:spermidine synthase
MIYLAVATLSAAVLAYEVLLMRLLAIVQWHHFAYMVISIALLGFGASGTFLAFAQDRLKPHFVLVFAANAALFGILALVSFAIGERVPFNALEVVWNPEQLLYLAALYVLFTIPFFCGANCIGLALACFGERIGPVYCWNLIGSGIGALAVVGALFLFSPSETLRLVAGLGLVAAGLVCFEGKGSARRLAGVVFLGSAVVVTAFAPSSWTALVLSEYKGLQTTLRIPGTEVVGEYSSPLGLLSVVRSHTVPLRHAPGLSLNNRIEPPPQIGVFTDGDALSVITKFEGRPEALAYLDYMTSALPYHLVERPSVLILGAGGGADVLQATYHQARRIDAVELNPQFVRLVQEEYAEFAGGLYARPEVHVHIAEARGFVARSDERWDLVQIPLLDSSGASGAGVQSLTESYLYTVEALREYLAHLTPNGYLSITRWLKVPPRDALKLFATALSALEEQGVDDPASRLLLIRGWNTTTLLIKNGEISPQDIEATRRFAEQRSFDLAYYAGITPHETNRFNRLQEAFLYDGATALVGPGRQEFLERYKFDLRPTWDDRPYFFDFFKWRSLSEFLELRTQGGAGLLELGYIILLATLLQAALLSVVLILLPLWVRGRSTVPHADRGRVFVYFFGLGLAFLFLEIAFIQRFIVFLSHPLYTIAVVICSFLVFAGLGSGLAPRLQDKLAKAWLGKGSRATEISAIDVAVWAIAGIGLVYLVALPALFRAFMPWPDPAKVIVSVLIIAPLAFAMGMPFPLGLSRVSARVPQLVPWAWGVNGCASVLSAVLAMMLAIHFGFTVVVAIAVALYVAVALVFRTWSPAPR